MKVIYISAVLFALLAITLWWRKRKHWKKLVNDLGKAYWKRQEWLKCHPNINPFLFPEYHELWDKEIAAEMLFISSFPDQRWLTTSWKNYCIEAREYGVVYT